MSESGERKLTPMYKYEHMRLVARQDHGFVRQESAKLYYLAGVSIKGPQSLSQRSPGREESNRDSQLDRNTMREKGQTKGDYHSRSIASEVSENLCQTGTS